MHNIDVQQIKRREVHEFLKWIHVDSTVDDLALLEAEYWQRVDVTPAPHPLEAIYDSQRMAGAYFTCLPGRLAMLGAVRTVNGADPLGVLLVRTLVNRLHEQFSAIQIQAAVVSQDDAAQRILRGAGFRHLTSIDQMWTNPYRLNIDPMEDRPLTWTPANQLTRSDFSALIQQTFVDSLDCPELNGLRDPMDVLDSFAMGRPFEEIPLWEVAWLDGQFAGCLLLSEYTNHVTELTYMGLAPSARHRGLGKQFVNRAMEQTRALGSSMIVLGVDVHNIPAVKTYTRCGFLAHQRMEVFLFG